MKIILYILLFISTSYPQLNNFVWWGGGVPKDTVVVSTDSTVYISFDSGNTWTSSICHGTTGSNPVSALYFYHDTLFAGRTWIHRSTNLGLTWTEIKTGLSGNYINSIISLDTTLYACNYGSGLYISVDNGLTWSHPGDTYAPYGQGLCVSNGAVFDCESTGGGDYFIFRVTNQTMNWQNVIDGYSSCATTVQDSIIISGRGTTLLRSNNYGLNGSWTAYFPYITGLDSNGIYSFTSNSTTIFAGFGTALEGVYKSTDRGYHWTYSDLSGLTIYFLACKGNDIYAGTSDGVYRSTHNGNGWVKVGMSGKQINALVVK